MNDQHKVPEVELERLALGQLPVDYERDVIAALKREPDGMARLEAIESSNKEILEQYPPHLMAIQIKERAGQLLGRAPAKSKWWVALPALGTAAAAVLLIWFALPSDKGEPGTRIKGDETAQPQILVFRQGKEESLPLSPGAVVGAGDVLQIKVLAARARYGVVFSLDGRGAVTLHFPAADDGSTQLQQDTAVALPYSYKLDDAPKFERFFFVTADHPIDVKRVLAAGHKLGPDPASKLGLGAGLEQRDLVLYKAVD